MPGTDVNFDFDRLERSARKLMEVWRYIDPLKIYFFTAQGPRRPFLLGSRRKIQTSSTVSRISAPG